MTIWDSLDGDPGVGKSKLLKHCCIAQGLKQLSVKDIEPIGVDEFNHPVYANQQNGFYEISAGTPNAAFHQGALVIYDEIDDSLKLLLNSLLEGKDAEGHPPQHAGFMLLASRNPATSGIRK